MSEILPHYLLAALKAPHKEAGTGSRDIVFRSRLAQDQGESGTAVSVVVDKGD